jgi:hypothetical protein
MRDARKKERSFQQLSSPGRRRCVSLTIRAVSCLSLSTRHRHQAAEPGRSRPVGQQASSAVAPRSKRGRALGDAVVAGGGATRPRARDQERVKKPDRAGQGDASSARKRGSDGFVLQPRSGPPNNPSLSAPRPKGSGQQPLRRDRFLSVAVRFDAAFSQSAAVVFALPLGELRAKSGLVLLPAGARGPILDR